MTIDDLLIRARKMGASDVHVTVGIPPKCRVNGELVTLMEGRILPADSKALVEQMIPGRLVERFNREGEVDFSYAIKGVGRFRVNIFKQRGTMSFVIRLVNTEIPSPESLGLPQSVLELVKKKRGLILVTGPTGSGKSTTLASLIHIINQTQNKHIITLEDPIEYVYTPDLCVINQREVGKDTASFSEGLRASLREDPDVILIGEMRDKDTIETAITAAETGHLVFGTLHTGSASDAIDRMVQVFPEGMQNQIRLQLSMTLMAVISQQLVKKKTGGRVLASEVMVVTDGIRNMIRGGNTPQIANAIATSAAIGGQTMDQSLVSLVRSRQIDKAVAVEYSHDQAYVKKNA